MIRHHPGETTLVAFAAGTLPPLHATVLNHHLEACPACKGMLRNLNEVGGALLASLPPAQMHAHALERTLDQLDKNPGVTPAADRLPLSTPAATRWRWLGFGVRLAPLVSRDVTGTRLDLIRVSPGIALPSHTHSGPETVCVLQGSFSDETGTYELHDMAESDGTLLHRPIAAPGPACICIVATTGLLRANTWGARLFQSLLDV